VKRGITGHVRKYRHGVLSADGDIEQLAGLTVIENNRGDFYIGKYREYPRADQRETSKTAVLPLQAVNTPAGFRPKLGCSLTQERAVVGASPLARVRRARPMSWRPSGVIVVRSMPCAKPPLNS
jgi:hypothetical protein